MHLSSVCREREIPFPIHPWLEECITLAKLNERVLPLERGYIPWFLLVFYIKYLIELTYYTCTAWCFLFDTLFWFSRKRTVWRNRPSSSSSSAAVAEPWSVKPEAFRNTIQCGYQSFSFIFRIKYFKLILRRRTSFWRCITINKF